jgi:hypothetical protein
LVFKQLFTFSKARCSITLITKTAQPKVENSAQAT